MQLSEERESSPQPFNVQARFHMLLRSALERFFSRLERQIFLNPKIRFANASHRLLYISSRTMRHQQPWQFPAASATRQTQSTNALPAS